MQIAGKNICLSCMREIPDDQKKCLCGFDEKENNKSHELKLGTILKQSILVGKSIGQGGFGITYIAYDLNLEVKIAIKEFYLQNCVERDNSKSNALNFIGEESKKVFEERKGRFIDEARILAKLPHDECIVEVMDYFEENNTAYIVMEFAEGETLNSYIIRNGKMSGREAVELTLPLISSLSKIHSQNIIHRDIRPDNIMVNQDKNVKLLDFGNAREYSGAADDNTSIVFSSGYAALEQYSLLDRRGAFTDVYAICAVIFTCITRQKPMDVPKRLEQTDYDVSASLDKIEKSPLNAVIAKGMALDSSDRYQTMDDLAAALEEALKSIAPNEKDPKAESSIDAKDRSGAGKNNIILATILGILILAVCIILFNLFRSSRDNTAKESSEEVSLVETSSTEEASVNESTEMTDGADEAGMPDATEESVDNVAMARIYLKSHGEASAKSVDKDYKIIEDRLERYFGSGEYLQIFDDHAEINMPLDKFDENGPEVIMDYILLRPMKLYLAYDYFNYIEIDKNSIDDIAVEKDVYENWYMDGVGNETVRGTVITLTLNDELAGFLSEKLVDWQELYYRRNGGFHSFVTGKSKEELREEPQLEDRYVLDEEGNAENLELGFDYKPTVPEDLEEYESVKFKNVWVSKDGKTVKCYDGLFEFKSDNSIRFDRDKVIDLITSELQATGDELSNHYDTCYLNTVVFQDAKKYEAEFGKLQVEETYFEENNIDCVDVTYSGKEVSKGDYIEALKVIRNILDKADIRYAIGMQGNNINNIVIRMPYSECGDMYYSIFTSAGQVGNICAFTEELDVRTNLNFGNTILQRRYEEDEYSINEDGSIEISIEPSEDSAFFKYEEFLNELKNAARDNAIAMIAGDGKYSYFTGQYDDKKEKVVIDYCSFTDNGKMTESVQDYFRLLFVAWEESNSSIGAYRYKGYEKVFDTFEEAKNYEKDSLPDEFIHNKQEYFENIFTNETGLVSEVRFSDYGLGRITFFYDSGTIDMDLVTRAVKTVVDSELISEDDLFLNGIIVYNIWFMNSENNHRIMIRVYNDVDDNELCIYFWPYLLDESECDEVEDRILELRQSIEDELKEDSYTVLVYKTYEAGFVR